MSEARTRVERGQVRIHTEETEVVTNMSIMEAVRTADIIDKATFENEHGIVTYIGPDYEFDIKTVQFMLTAGSNYEGFGVITADIEQVDFTDRYTWRPKRNEVET